MAAINARAYAAQGVSRVLPGGSSLDSALREILAALPKDQVKEGPLIQEMMYGAVRFSLQLQEIARHYLKRPLKKKDQDLVALLLIGIYQLLYMRIAPYAAVDETVNATADLDKAWAKGLVNGILRAFLRQESFWRTRLQTDIYFASSHPPWFIQKMQAAWPQQWQAILAANNAQAPMTLRVNAGQYDTEEYAARLRAVGIETHLLPPLPCALTLTQPVPVTQLPDFENGAASVQDGAAQWAALLLQAQAGEHVLDACAAPGGKTGHLLEHTPGITVIALDKDSERAQRIQQNLDRLRLTAKVMVGDASKPRAWWDGQLFDRILVDAPCSGTGVIRRHPDIKIHRTPQDIAKLKEGQARILAALWPLLVPGGRLLYATCSILSAENEEQMIAFCAQHPDAAEINVALPYGVRRSVGQQILPNEQGMDGFYYACIQKTKNAVLS